MKQLLFTLLLALPLTLYAQKRPLDHSVYDGWESVSGTTVSKNGKIVAYTVNPQEGDGRLVIRANGTEHIIPRGYNLTVTPDEQWAACQVRPLFQQTRQAKIKKQKDLDLPQDTLIVLRLADMTETRFPNVSSYNIGRKGNDAVAFLSSDTAIIAKKERKSKDIGRPCIVLHLATGVRDTLQYVKSFAFDRQGKTLSFTRQPKKNKMLAALYDVGSRRTTVLTDTLAFVGRPVFDEDGRQLLYTVSNDTVADGSRRCALYYAATDKGKGKSSNKKNKDSQTATAPAAFSTPKCLVAVSDTVGFPAGWCMNQHTVPSFSHDGKRIFAGIAPYQPPKDTTLVPFETAGLDLWRWDDPETPSMQNVNVQNELKRTYTAVYDEKTRRLRPLSDGKFERLRLVSRGDVPYAIVTDRSRNVLSQQWDGRIEEDLMLVNLQTGQRQLITKGKIADETASPGGRFVAWYDFTDTQWHLYDISTGKSRTITDKTWNVNFWDEEYDCPQEPAPYGIAGWTEGDNDVLIYDRYDIWKIPTKEGKPAVCLTQGNGRKEKRTYRYVNTKQDEAARFIAPKENLILRVFDNTTKENGIAELRVDQPGQPVMMAFGGYTYSGMKRSELNDVILYQRGNFQEPMDLYMTGDNFATSQRLTAINPQQKDYNWGTAELYHWTAYDGTKLDGILYKPEDFDPAKKYPVMIYFYERRSESLYSYVAPQPSWSTVNLAFYTSRGYVVFVPDIVYPLDGMPGEAAYNCVVSGAESLKQYPWIDGDRMAIQGQSWGGYQVAYLITRTNMFRAAGAGAPVSNMTSAYGGIRWESGMSRQFQYEHTQSRIGKTLWEAPDLYLKNSCLFTLPNVQTPVLIMHNDQDGAVPWYQGIEMFMGLKRLQKPAWMIQYNNEAHNLKERRNRKDLSIRLQQFFDHYLKDAPMPAWMKNGIPATRKGQYFGLEE